MARPRHEQPTPAELDLLKILWDHGPCTGRAVSDVVNQSAESPRAYTSVMSLLNVMTEKGLLRRRPKGRLFVYEAAVPREKTLQSMLHETLERAFDGSASLLVAHLLDRSTPSADELEQIRGLIDEYQRRQTEKGG